MGNVHNQRRELTSVNPNPGLFKLLGGDICELQLDPGEYEQLIDYLKRVDGISQRINELEEEHHRKLEILEGQRRDVLQILETAWNATHRGAQLDGRLLKEPVPEMIENNVQNVWILPDGKKAVWAGKSHGGANNE